MSSNSMKWVRGDGQSNPLERLGIELGFFHRYADSFRKATGMELDLIYADGEPWNSVAHRVKNPICREHAHNAQEGELCEECTGCACRVALAQQRFHTVTCWAGRIFSVCPLGQFDGAEVLLLTGRVHMGETDLLEDKSSTGYQGSLELIELFLPYLRNRLHMDLLLSAREFSNIVRDATQYVDKNFMEKISLATVAKACGVGEDSLSRSFSKQTGNRLSRYIAGVRIGHAMDLLRDEKLGIADIAFEVGFQSLSQFNRTFRALREMSPSEFRRQERDIAH